MVVGYVCARVCSCVCVVRLNGRANRKLGTPGPSARCQGSHVTLWQHSIIDSHYHIRFCVYMLMCVRICTTVYTSILWTANNWLVPVYPLLCLRLCVFPHTHVYALKYTQIHTQMCICMYICICTAHMMRRGAVFSIQVQVMHLESRGSYLFLELHW